jgi:hypothetical protein
MSYELGAAAAPHRRRRRAIHRPIHFSDVGTPRLRVGRMIGGVVKTLPITSYVLHGYGYERSDGLGLSLKPPRWLRKMQPGVYIRKHPLILAPLALIPGVAPAIAAGATAAGGALLSVGKAGAGLVSSLFRSQPKLPTTALRQALAMGTGAGATPIVATPPAFTPDQMAVSTPVGEPTPMLTSGGGGGAVSPIGPTDPGSEPESGSPAHAGTAGPNPLLIVGGIALLVFAAKAMRKHR